MKLSTIAYKNIVIRKTKIALLVIGLIVAISTLVSVTTLIDSFKKKIDGQLSKFGYNILIYPKSSDLALSYGGMDISGISTYKIRHLGKNEINEIKKLQKENQMIVSPKLLQGVTVKGKSALFIGINKDKELSIKKWWRGAADGHNDHDHGNGKGELLSESGRSVKDILSGSPLKNTDLIVGSVACEKLGLRTDDVIKINGVDFRVRVALQDTGSQDDNIIFGNLLYSQKLFNKQDKYNLIEIAVVDTNELEKIVNQLTRALPNASVSSVKQAVKYKEIAMNQLGRFGYSVTGIIIVISGMIVFSTMMSSVIDRTREIGVLRAVGFRKSKIIKIILTEAVILSLIGGIGGYAAGIGISTVFPVFVKSFDISISFNLSTFIIAILMALIIGVISSIIPANKAAKLDPVIALKEL